VKKLIIIGANNFQISLIAKAKEMGFESHVFAWEKGAVGKNIADYFYPVSITEKEEIFQIAREIKPDGVISIASDLASITVNYLANKLGLIGNSLKCTELTTDKYLMRSVLSLNCLPCPDFYLVENSDSVKKYLSYPLIVKPTDRSGSRGVSKIENSKILGKAIKRALVESFNKKVIVEEFIEGQEYSIEMISWQGKHHFLQITEKETFGPPYFVEKAHHQPANLNEIIKKQLIDTIKKALSVLDVRYGASHSEVIVTRDNQIYITEIGARMGGDYIGSDLVYLSTGFDFVKATIEIACGIAPEIILNQKKHSGIYYLNTNPGVVANIIQNDSEYDQIIRKEIYVSIGSRVSEITESNARTACFIYCNPYSRFIPKYPVIEIQTEDS
jgi:biotin carboxylase